MNRSHRTILAASIGLLLPATSQASTGRTLRAIYEILGPTGSLIALGIFGVLGVAGLILQAKRGKRFEQKQELLKQWEAEKNGNDSLKTLVECFFMGPVEFKEEQAQHNAKVLGLLTDLVADDNKERLVGYRKKFEQRPAKFGIIESNDMESFIESLAKN